jgi:hypothetical protein
MWGEDDTIKMCLSAQRERHGEVFGMDLVPTPQALGRLGYLFEIVTAAGITVGELLVYQSYPRGRGSC